jgi:hypothetical protein
MTDPDPAERRAGLTAPGIRDPGAEKRPPVVPVIHAPGGDPQQDVARGEYGPDLNLLTAVLTGVIIVVGALGFLAALALGSVVQHLPGLQ